MRCTAKKTLEVAAEANIALIVQVKDNQPTLHQQIEEIAATTAPLGSAHSRDKGRSRDESRTVTVFDPADKLADSDWHPHVAAIIRVQRDVFARNAKTGLLRYSTETAFYVSNMPITATRAARPSARTGGSKPPPTTAETSPLAKTARASAPTPAYSLACAVSPSTFSRLTVLALSARIATVPLSQESTTC
jgi:hypothetical protein